MGSSTQLSTSNRKRGVAQFEVLAESGTDLLIQSSQGFLVIFRNRPSEVLSRQLRDFDLLEWRRQEEMVQMFPHELEGMVSGDRMRDAADLISACSVAGTMIVFF